MEKSFSEGGLQRCSLYTLLYSDMNYVATLLTYKFSFMFQSNFTHQEGQGGGGGGEEGARSGTEKRCSHLVAKRPSCAVVSGY